MKDSLQCIFICSPCIGQNSWSSLWSWKPASWSPLEMKVTADPSPSVSSGIWAWEIHNIWNNKGRGQNKQMGGSSNSWPWEPDLRTTAFDCLTAFWLTVIGCSYSTGFGGPWETCKEASSLWFMGLELNIFSWPSKKLKQDSEFVLGTFLGGLFKSIIISQLLWRFLFFFFLVVADFWCKKNFMAQFSP